MSQLKVAVSESRGNAMRRVLRQPQIRTAASPHTQCHVLEARNPEQRSSYAGERRAQLHLSLEENPPASE